jgi:hypothetical protein
VYMCMCMCVLLTVVAVYSRAQGSMQMHVHLHIGCAAMVQHVCLLLDSAEQYALGCMRAHRIQKSISISKEDDHDPWVQYDRAACKAASSSSRHQKQVEVSVGSTSPINCTGCWFV